MVRKYGLVIDLERCIGCHTCTIACKLENGLEKGSWIRVRTIGGPHQDTPEGEAPNLRMHFLPILCMHCGQPPCQDVCPTGAIFKHEDGIVLIDEEKCDGCKICVSACPYEALTYDEEKKIVQKCTLCSHRLAEGLEPFCLVCCETEAIYFGDVSSPDSELKRILVRQKAGVLKPELGTRPSIYYCPTSHGRIE